jgi:acyl carrier protein
MALEQEFSFTMRPEDTLRIDSIGDALGMVERHSEVRTDGAI